MNISPFWTIEKRKTTTRISEIACGRIMLLYFGRVRVEQQQKQQQLESGGDGSISSFIVRCNLTVRDATPLRTISHTKRFLSHFHLFIFVFLAFEFTSGHTSCHTRHNAANNINNKIRPAAESSMARYFVVFFCCRQLMTAFKRQLNRIYRK